MGNTCNCLCAGLLLSAPFAATAQYRLIPSSDHIVQWAYPWLSPSDAIKSQIIPAEIRHVPESNSTYSQTTMNNLKIVTHELSLPLTCQSAASNEDNV